MSDIPAGGAAAGPASDADVVRAAVTEIAAAHAGPVRPDDRLVEDLHLDSMARIELAVLLEVRLARPVPDAVVMKARTVSDLVAAVGP